MATATARASAPGAKPDQPHGVLHLPRVHVSYEDMPTVRMPAGMTGRLLWWGGLAALVALEVVEWPVAALVAAGSWVGEQHAKEAAQARRPEEERAAAKES
jgi:hypothetical protein